MARKPPTRSVTWYRSAQARYLIALDNLHRVKLTTEQRLLLLEVTLAGREKRELPIAQISQLKRLIATLAPTQARRRNPSPTHQETPCNST